MWSTILLQNNDIVIILSTMLRISQYAEQYCDNIVQHIVYFANIVIIYDNNIVSPFGGNTLQYCHNIVSPFGENTLQYCHNIGNIFIIYCYNIVEIDNMVKNIVAIFFTMPSKSNANILLTVLLQHIDNFVSNLGKVCCCRSALFDFLCS